MAKSRYFIEQAPDRYYDELKAAKDRARRLSKSFDGGVYVIVEEYSAEAADYIRTGSVAFYDGYQDAREGSLA